MLLPKVVIITFLSIHLAIDLLENNHFQSFSFNHFLILISSRPFFKQLPLYNISQDWIQNIYIEVGLDSLSKGGPTMVGATGSKNHIFQPNSSLPSLHSLPLYPLLYLCQMCQFDSCLCNLCLPFDQKDPKLFNILVLKRLKLTNFNKKQFLI